METVFVTDLPVVMAAVTSPDANNHFLLDTIMRLKWRTCFKSQQQMTKHENFKAWLLLQGHWRDLGMRVKSPWPSFCTLYLVRLTLATERTRYQTINTPLAHFRLNECQQRSSCLHRTCLNAILHICQHPAGVALHERTAALPGRAIRTYRLLTAEAGVAVLFFFYQDYFWFTKHWIKFWT